MLRTGPVPQLEIQSSAGLLTARFDPPDAPAAAGGPVAAVVCHPHPLHGGTMDNKVVFTVARTLRERGLAVLRFNFRGAGGSEGRHDDGVGERDDVRAAVDELAKRAPGPLLVAGFSFGSFVGGSVGAEDERVTALLAVAPPVQSYDYGTVSRTDKPLGVIYARDDELVPAEHVERWIDGCVRPPAVFPIDGAGHLFHGRLRPLSEAVGSYVAGLTG